MTELQSPSPRARLEAMAWVVPLLASLAAASASLRNRFTNDDDVLIVSNRYVHDASHLWQNLTSDYFYSSATASIGYYRPLTKLAFIVEYHFFGASPFGYHAISALWHVAGVLVGYALLRRLSFAPVAAGFAATFYAVHPSQGESLGIIASRSDLTVAFGTFAALLFYIEFRQTGRTRWLALALAAETFALGSKESAVAIVALVALWELAEGGFAWRTLRDRPYWLWTAVPLVLYAAVRMALHIAPIVTHDNRAWSARLLGAEQLVGGLLLRALVPTAWPPYLHARFPDAHPALAIAGAIALLGCVALSVFAIIRWPRGRWGVALLWLPALPVVLPVFSAIHVSDDPRVLILADRWVLPSALGAGALWAALAEAAWVRSPRPLVRGMLVAVAALWTVANTLAARGESASFHDEGTRMRWIAEALRERRDLGPAEEEYVWAADAMQAEARGDWPVATRVYAQLLSRRPQDYSRRFNLARALLASGRRDEGLFQAYLCFEGTTPEGRRLPVNDSFYRHRSERALLLGTVFESREDVTRARHYYGIALQLDPANHAAAQRLASLHD